MANGLYTQKTSRGYDKWFWNYDIFNFEKSPPTPKMLNLWLFLPIFILKISVKAIKNPLFYWVSKSLLVLGFSEWNPDFPKMLPTQGFLLPKGNLSFLLCHVSDAYRFWESHVNHSIFYFLLVFQVYIFIIFLNFNMLVWFWCNWFLKMAQNSNFRIFFNF